MKTFKDLNPSEKIYIAVQTPLYPFSLIIIHFLPPLPTKSHKLLNKCPTGKLLVRTKFKSVLSRLVKTISLEFYRSFIPKQLKLLHPLKICKNPRLFYCTKEVVNRIHLITDRFLYSTQHSKF